MFADDKTVIVTEPTLNDAVNKAIVVLEKFQSWCHKNQLIVNIEKTNLIHFKLKANTTNIQIDYKQFRLKNATVTKFLGIHIDETLKFTEQINIVCKKLNTLYYQFLKEYIRHDQMIMYYYTNVFSTMKYGILIWGRSSEIQRVFVTQKRIIRLIYNIPYRNTCKNCFIQNEIFTIHALYTYELITYMHSKKLFNKIKVQNKYDTRTNLAYDFSHRTGFYEKSPIYTGYKIYCKLPTKIMNEENDRQFNKQLKNYLIKEAPYDIKSLM